MHGALGIAREERGEGMWEMWKITSAIFAYINVADMVLSTFPSRIQLDPLAYSSKWKLGNNLQTIYFVVVELQIFFYNRITKQT